MKEVSSSMKTCSSCLYYDYSKGLCHINPPIVVVVQGFAGLYEKSVFPDVGDYDWCGKHSDKVPPPIPTS